MIRLVDISERRPPRADEEISTFFTVDNAIPSATLETIATEQQRLKQHRELLREEIKKRDAELIKNRREEQDKMPVRLIAVEERKMPRSKVGKFSSLADIQAAIAMLSDSKFKSQVNMAIEVVLNEADYGNLKKDGTEDPARSIVNMLKRKFDNDGLPLKCYASDDRTITIMKAPPAPPKKK